MKVETIYELITKHFPDIGYLENDMPMQDTVTSAQLVAFAHDVSAATQATCMDEIMLTDEDCLAHQRLDIAARIAAGLAGANTPPHERIPRVVAANAFFYADALLSEAAKRGDDVAAS